MTRRTRSRLAEAIQHAQERTPFIPPLPAFRDKAVLHLDGSNTQREQQDVQRAYALLPSSVLSHFPTVPDEDTFDFDEFTYGSE